MITQSFYTLTNTGFVFLIDFAWTTPKSTKSPITTPKKYDDHPYRPNIGSTPPPSGLHTAAASEPWDNKFSMQNGTRSI